MASTSTRTSRRPREDDELASALGRLFALAPHDQLRAYAELRDYLLAAGGVRGEPRLDRQVAALEALERVRLHLGLEAAPTMAEFDASPAELRLELSAQQVGRLFGGYRAAVSHWAGERPAPSAAQEAKRRAAVGRGRSHEAYLAALNVWLKMGPFSEGVRDYNAFAREYNDGGHALWLPSASAIKKGLTLGWSDCLRVARREISLAEANRHQVEARESRTDGSHDLVGPREIGSIMNVGMTTAWQLSHRDGFPPPALVLGKRGFLREHVVDYRDGERSWSHERNYLRPLYLDVEQLAAAVALKRAVVATRASPSLCPPPTGMVSGCRYWLKADVEAWVATHCTLVARRRARFRS
jgi:predicted DNA-binding transcriptional regulator AlpA